MCNGRVKKTKTKLIKRNDVTIQLEEFSVCLLRMYDCQKIGII